MGSIRIDLAIDLCWDVRRMGLADRTSEAIHGGSGRVVRHLHGR
jgi:hypothetical protein